MSKFILFKCYFRGGWTEKTVPSVATKPTTPSRS
jgi:hypothetical protein